MEITEIIQDALAYPINNIKAFIIYLILGIILGIATAGTVGAVAASAAIDNVLAALGSGIIGVVIALFIAFIITGYELDIVKYGIERNSGAPGIDIVRQFINGVKLFAVEIVYFIIPIVISAILAVIFQHWVSILIAAILGIIFGLAAFMAQCRLAKTGDIGYALSIMDAIDDISRVGVVKLLLLLIIIFIIAFILYFIVGLISQWNPTVGGIIMGIVGVYITFFSARATGLIYSDV
ncbi:MAG: DUF4013 domain-containing protein [Solibacillus sp.]